MAMRLATTLVGAILLAGLLGCSAEEKKNTVLTGGTDYAALISISPLYIQVSSQYENNTTQTVLGICNIDPSSGVTTKSCTIRVPELQLYYSDILFNVGSASMSYCEQISFRPYFFQYKNTAHYNGTSGGTEDLDCSLASTAGCYGGAAPNLVTGFPSSASLYFLPVNNLSRTYTLKSSNTLRQSLTNKSYFSNVNVANNLVTRTSDINNSNVDYVGGSMVDYRVSCYDRWYGTKYSLTLTIGDEDTEGTPSSSDQVYDWGN